MKPLHVAIRLWPHTGGASFVDLKEIAHVFEYVGLEIGFSVTMELQRRALFTDKSIHECSGDGVGLLVRQWDSFNPLRKTVTHGKDIFVSGLGLREWTKYIYLNPLGSPTKY